MSVSTHSQWKGHSVGQQASERRLGGLFGRNSDEKRVEHSRTVAQSIARKRRNDGLVREVRDMLRAVTRRCVH
jgi:hypothetical protein